MDFFDHGGRFHENVKDQCLEIGYGKLFRLGFPIKFSLTGKCIVKFPRVQI